ncbi:MAG: hypothetical protein M0C28_06595 [Candidatus Moduliflexus flocculans]|nr:hypothetical protein [Candidatus Moduliflexus flocculans]
MNFAERTAQVTGALASHAADRRPFARRATTPPNCAMQQPKPNAIPPSSARYQRLARNTIMAGVLAAPLMLAEMAGWLPALVTPGGQRFWIVTGLLTLAVMIYTGGHFFTSAWRQFRHHNANMDTLIALGTGVGLVLFDAGGAVPRQRAESGATRLFRGGGHHHRPDQPRFRAGKPGARQGLGRPSSACSACNRKPPAMVECDQERDVPIESLGIASPDPGAAGRENPGGRCGRQRPFHGG